MPKTFLTQGLTAIRDALSAQVTHVGVSTDQTAHAAAQSGLSPGGGTDLIKSSTNTPVDATTFDAAITVTGVEYPAYIYTIGACDGATTADAMTRTVKSNGFGLDAGDEVDITVRMSVSDAG